MTAGAIPVPTVVPLRVPDPGQSKFSIDSNTRVELRCAMSGSEQVQIFYTLNGTRPDPFGTSGALVKSTLLYQGPFTLPVGKVTIKVVACLLNGKESAVCTKTLNVAHADPEELLMSSRPVDEAISKKKSGNDSAAEDGKFMHPKQGAWTGAAKINKNDGNGSGYSAPFVDKRQTSPLRINRMKTDLEYEMGLNSNRWKSESFKTEIPPRTVANALRVSRDTDFLRCIACFAQRPADPNAKFCHECGYPCTPISEKRLPPPEPGQMGTCIRCHSTVPLNTDKCVVCETDLAEQFQPQASLRTADKKSCTECLTLNPPSVSFCLQCEAPLSSDIVKFRNPLPSPPKPVGVDVVNSSMITCSKCSRVNNPDARFCDWCGSKPQVSRTYVSCLKCTAANQLYARFCATCGALMEAPDRQDPRNSGYLLSGVPVKEAIKTMDSRATATWLPVSAPSPANMKPKTSVQTQTAGLFYPSNKALEKYLAEDESRKVFKEEKKIPLTAISPGKGYWRQNVDFITNHMKAHAQNDADFRKMVGEPKLGKLMSATIHEDGHEFSLVMNFPIRSHRDGNDPFKGKNMLLSKNNILNSLPPKSKLLTDDEDHTEPSDEDTMVSSFASDEKALDIKNKKTKPAKKKKTTKKPTENSNLSSVNRLLFNEIGSKGEGNVDTVKQLLSEDGANVESVNSDGDRLLIVAVKNMRHDLIEVLAGAGADLNKKAGPHGNTALHEAVLQAHGGDQKMVEALLDAGATPTRKNDKGQTPYDLALEKGYEATVTALASTMGKDMLEKLAKPTTMVGSGDASF